MISRLLIFLSSVVLEQCWQLVNGAVGLVMMISEFWLMVLQKKTFCPAGIVRAIDLYHVPPRSPPHVLCWSFFGVDA